MDYQTHVLKQLRDRNNVTSSFKDLIGRYTSLLASEKTLSGQKLSLEAQCVALQHRNRELESTVGSGGGVASKELEAQLQAKQAELNESYKVRAEASQQVLELTQKIKEMEEQFQAAQREIDVFKRALEEEKQAVRRMHQAQEEKDITINVLKAELLQLQVELVKSEEKVRDLTKESKALMKAVKVAKEEVKVKEAEMQQQQNKPFSLSSVFGMSTTTPSGVAPSSSTGALPTAGSGGAGAPPRRTLSTSTVDLDGGRIGVVVPTHCKRTLRVEKGELNCVAFSHNGGSSFVTGGMDKLVRVWDTATGRIKSNLYGAERAIMCVGFSWNTDFVLAASNDNAVRVWSLETGRVQHELRGHSGKVFAAKFSSDTTKIVTGSHDRSIRTWDAERGYCNRTIFCSSSCNDIELTRDGSMCFSGHLDNHLRVFDVRAGGDPVQDLASIHTAQITSVSITDDGNYVLTNSRENNLKILDTRTYRVVHTLTAPHYNVGVNWARACFSPEGRYACAGGADGQLFVWDANQGIIESMLTRKAEEEPSLISCCAWSPLGTTVATSDRGGLISLWG